MSLNWDFREKCGEVILKQGEREFTLNMYQGNAYLIFLSEWEEDGEKMYQLYSFCSDKVHAKILFGLSKNLDGKKINIFNEEGNKFVKFRFNKACCRKLGEIVGLIVDAFDEIEIEIYSEEVEK